MGILNVTKAHTASAAVTLFCIYLQLELSDGRFSVGNPDMESAKSAPVSPNAETVEKDAFSGNPL